MNLHAKFKATRPQRSAEPTRRRFTADELEAMERAGILDAEEKVELIDGEIITMAAKTPRHEDMRTELATHFSERHAGTLKVAQEPAFYLSDHWEPEPDILLFPRHLLVSEVRGDTALLVVEVAVSSLSTELTVKANMYAAHGVREYWVVDAKRLVTHVHRGPGDNGYASVQEIPAGQRIEPLLLPALVLDLADLGLKPLTDDEATGHD
ncbi:MAG: Uma2 family endonuclease [Hyphomicrobiaceae bacterium]